MSSGLLIFLSAWTVAEAGHCYNIQGQAACEGNAQGNPCAYCNGACQMATDVCAKAVSQNDLPGSAFFKDFSHLLKSNPTQMNYGISVTDIDNDGMFEFVVAGFGSPNQAQKWNAGSKVFEDVALGKTALQDASGKAIGVAACDVDGDGYEELYVLNTNSYSGQTTTSDKLLDRDASGTYSDIFDEAGNQVSANYVAGRSCACLDRLGKGRYGVFVANYGGPMKLFEMPEGGRVIQDKAPDVGMAKTTGGRALIAGPIVTNRMDVFANNEGWGGGRRLKEESSGKSSPESEDKQRRLGHRSNYLFASDGSGSFTDVAGDMGLLDASQTGRGTTLLDSNGDGLLDIVYGNWNGPHRLFVQEKDANNCPKFVDKAPAAMTVASPIRTVIVADFDNDGYDEIFWNNIPGANLLFRKLPTDSDWTQIKIGDALEANGYGTGAAVGDFDGDGQLELVVAHGESRAQPLSYFRPNAGKENHWLRVLPLTSQGAPARGASVSLRAGGRSQLRVIDAGSGYLCQMEPVAHFGLGALTAVESITVTWPDGASHTIAGPSIDQMLRVPRPAGLATPAFHDQCGKVVTGSTLPSPAPEPEPEPMPPPATAAPTTAAPTTVAVTTTARATALSGGGAIVAAAPAVAAPSSGSPTAAKGPIVESKVVTSTGTVSVKMSKADATQLVAKPEAKAAFASAVAKTTGLDASEVTITAIYIDGTKVARRLTLATSAQSTVSFEWEATGSAVVSTAHMDATTLQAQIVAEAKAVAGVTVVITALPLVQTAPPPKTRNAAAGPDITSAASSLCTAGFTALVCLLLGSLL